jgi:adenylate cyclase
MPMWRVVELIEFDWLTVLTASEAPTSPIIIVGIDEDSFDEIGLQWPWPRSLHAKLIQTLAQAGAAVIAFDVEFIDSATPAEDQILADAIHANRPVVLAAHEDYTQTAHITQQRAIYPLDIFLEKGATHGFVNLNPDADTLIREVPAGDARFWQVVLKEYGWTSALNPAIARIRYVEPYSFHYVSYYQALAPEEFLPPESFRDKIILIGRYLKASPALVPQQADMLASPFFRVTEQLTPGVEIHANIIDGALRGRWITEMPVGGQWLVFILVAALSLVRSRPWRPGQNALLTAGFSIILLMASISLFSLSNYWLPTVAPIAGLWISYVGQECVAFFEERSKALFIRRVFDQYVSSDIVEKMLAHPEQLVLGGVRREVTFIFTDLAGFTTLSEELEPEALVDLIKDYFEGMGAIILKHQGTIERIVGDGLVAFFNAPLDQPDHAARAIRCAMELDTFAQGFAITKRAQNVFLGDTRMGVNTGEVTVGNFGSTKRFHYTAMGDPINTAARLEGANKYFGTRICVSGTTANQCPDLLFRPIAEVVLKGKSNPILVYEPLKDKGDIKQKITEYCSAYDLIKINNTEAIVAFEKISETETEDPLVYFHLGRLRNGEHGVLIALVGK